jgi:hypothetical protein
MDTPSGSISNGILTTLNVFDLRDLPGRTITNFWCDTGNCWIGRPSGGFTCGNDNKILLRNADRVIHGFTGFHVAQVIDYVGAEMRSEEFICLRLWRHAATREPPSQPVPIVEKCEADTYAAQEKCGDHRPQTVGVWERLTDQTQDNNQRPADVPDDLKKSRFAMSKWLSAHSVHQLKWQNKLIADTATKQLRGAPDRGTAQSVSREK